MKGVKMRDGVLFYQVDCSHCGKECYIQKSFGMIMGFLNIGHFDCDVCGQMTRVTFNNELQRMDILEDEK